MFETEVICNACKGTHIVWASLIPRSFSYECPGSGERVELPFRDPVRVPKPWSEVSVRSSSAIPVDDAQQRGSFEM